MPRLCKFCEQEIPESRRRALPNADTCVQHSEATPVQGFMTWEHKTAPTITIGPHAEVLRKYARKGVHAQLPMASKVRAEKELGTTVTEPPQLRIPEAPRPEYESRQIHRASCHPHRPRVTPDGKCLDCAVAWYRERR